MLEKGRLTGREKLFESKIGFSSLYAALTANDLADCDGMERPRLHDFVDSDACSKLGGLGEK